MAEPTNAHDPENDEPTRLHPVRAIVYGIARGLAKLTTVGLPKGPHVTRYQMYRHLKGISLPTDESHRILAISTREPFCRMLSLKGEVVEAHYPEHNITALNFPDESFDYVVSDQVLEHVEGDPLQAVEETRRLLKPGGIAIHTTCFINPIHGAPSDFWRFTPQGMKYLGKNFSRVIDYGGWGNPLIWILVAVGLRFYPIPHAKWHPLHWIATWNKKTWPVSTWLIAVK